MLQHDSQKPLRFWLSPEKSDLLQQGESNPKGLLLFQDRHVRRDICAAPGGMAGQGQGVGLAQEGQATANRA